MTKNCLHLTAPISVSLVLIKIVYLYFDDVKGLCKPIPDFITRNVLRYPTIGGRVYNFPRKRQGKKVYCRIFAISVNVYPMYFSHVAERFTHIGPHKPLWRNSLEDTYLTFF